MIHFTEHLKVKLKEKKFSAAYEKELHIVRLAVEVAQARERQGLSQSVLAARAEITQQQLSKVENAKACNVETLLKIVDALGMELTLRPSKAARSHKLLRKPGKRLGGRTRGSDTANAIRKNSRKKPTGVSKKSGHGRSAVAK